MANGRVLEERLGLDRVAIATTDARTTHVSGADEIGDNLVRSALADHVTQAEVPDGRVTAIPVVSGQRIVGALRAAQPTSVTERDADRPSDLGRADTP